MHNGASPNHTQHQGNSFRGGKRSFNAAFSNNNHHKSGPKPAAPPAVPSFTDALGLPSKPPPINSSSKPKKKKRKHNQLGLTPRTEEHESSSDEDVDEEAKFANAAPDAALQVSYRGQTSTLQSPEDIEAWIAERRKKWPTAAKREVAEKEKAERKRKADEAKTARQEQQRLKKEEFQTKKKKQWEERKAAREKEKNKNKDSKTEEKTKDKTTSADAAISSLDAVTKAEIMAEKLRRKAEKQRLKAEKAEALLQAAILKAQASSQQHSAAVPSTNGEAPTEAVQEHDLTSDSLSISSSSSDPSDNGADDTSSQGSQSEPDSDSDSSPEQQSSKSTGPVRVPPPPRGKPEDTAKTTKPDAPLCRNFARNGQCPRGKKCQYRHERSIGKANNANGNEAQGSKKGIYQIVSSCVYILKSQAEMLIGDLIAAYGEAKGGKRRTASACHYVSWRGWIS